MKFTPNLTRTEWKQGLFALAVSLLLLPGLLGFLPLSPARQNLTYYFLNFALAVYVFRGFLHRNVKAALAQPLLILYYALLGYVAHSFLGDLAALAADLLKPGFINLNDQTILSRLDRDFALTAAAIVVLVPIAEECFFRGLLFRGVYDRSPALAWLASVGGFAAVHVMGYVGLYDPLSLLAAFIQYLPAGVVLCVAYQRGGSILCPILTHSIVNFLAIYYAAR